ncbi:DUF2177 family protein [Celeribacter arenosi]|uniref:DUF2177 family protein n=1 Tax=Celeribacter arenosi TaxID=792649 RepID=A0ABP7K9D2_9RHOB
MQLITLYLSTAVVFLGIDAVFLRLVMRPIFESHLGDWLLDDFRVTAAAIFYLFYVAGVLFFVSLPALQGDGTLASTLFKGALLGLMAYGTYEFTNYAVLDRWHPSMVAVDVAWGAILTGSSAVIGLAITRVVH